MIKYRQVERTEERAALELLFEAEAAGGSSPRSRRSSVEGLLAYLETQPTWLEGVWIAENDSKPRTAVALIGSPGRTATILLPNWGEMKSEDEVHELATLIREMASVIDDGKIRLLQAVVEPERSALNRAMQQAGFRHLADLLLLCKELHHEEQKPDLPLGMRWRSFVAGEEVELGRIIKGTYQKSLDCPGLNGLRQIDDVISGHRSAGEFVPGCWLILEGPDGPAGVLLVSRDRTDDGYELLYMGLAPPFRGRRLGELIVRQAARLASRRGGTRLRLAVDVENGPARRVYEATGFTFESSRRAWIYSTGTKDTDSQWGP
jgi:ribosomal protein S18 acetylase RimI-like enzyme